MKRLQNQNHSLRQAVTRHLPKALAEEIMAKANEEGLLEPGKLVLMAGFGAGMAWASAVVRW